MVARENKHNAYAKFGGGGGQTNSIMVFSEMAYFAQINREVFIKENVLKAINPECRDWFNIQRQYFVESSDLSS